MRYGLLRWILIFLFTEFNGDEKQIVCKWETNEVEGWKALRIVIPETSDFYGNESVVTVIRELDPSFSLADDGAYVMENPRVPTTVVREMLPLAADVMRCKRCAREFIVRIDV